MVKMKPPRRKRLGITRHSGENRNPEPYLTGSRIGVRDDMTPQGAGYYTLSFAIKQDYAGRNTDNRFFRGNLR